MNDSLKYKAAIAAIEEVEDGMRLGLGTGSTVDHYIRELGARVAGGLRVSAIATSLRSEDLAREVGIPIVTFADHPELDLTVDGADEVSPGLDLVKGLGGALVREKVVAHASRRLVIVVDESKLVDRLGSRAPVPIEVIPFARDRVAHVLGGIGGEGRLRRSGEALFVSDNGNNVIDWHRSPIEDAAAIERELASIPGIVDSGIFAGLASRVIVAGAGGVRRMDRPR